MKVMAIERKRERRGGEWGGEKEKKETLVGGKSWNDT